MNPATTAGPRAAYRQGCRPNLAIGPDTYGFLTSMTAVAVGARCASFHPSPPNSSSSPGTDTAGWGRNHPPLDGAPAAVPQSFLYLRPRYGAVFSTSSSRGAIVYQYAGKRP